MAEPALRHHNAKKKLSKPCKRIKRTANSFRRYVEMESKWNLYTLLLMVVRAHFLAFPMQISASVSYDRLNDNGIEKEKKCGAWKRNCVWLVAAEAAAAPIMKRKAIPKRAKRNQPLCIWCCRGCLTTRNKCLCVCAFTENRSKVAHF